jgi:hypothetical protein
MAHRLLKPSEELRTAMNTSPRAFAVAAIASVVALVAACSAEVGTPIPASDGTVAGGDPDPAPASDAGKGSAPTPPTSGGGSSQGGEDAAPAWPVDPEGATTADAGGDGFDAGSFPIDSGIGVPETSPPTSGPLGTCSNPACGTLTNECGCQATDSSGDTVQMGCQAGGECVCLVDQQVTGSPFAENGACGDSTSTAAQFLANCPCQ